MARDEFESMAVIPAPDVNYDEVWLAVKRSNGVFIERFGSRFASLDCSGNEEVRAEEQIFMDSAVTYKEGNTVTNVNVGTDEVITITTSEAHGYSNGDVVRLREIAGYPTLNNTLWTITNVTETTFQLDTQR